MATRLPNASQQAGADAVVDRTDTGAGTAGQSYAVINRITTSANRIDDRTIQIVVRER